MEQQSRTKDNYYSIFHEAFIKANEYIKNNQINLGFSAEYSGATACLVLYPQNNRNIIYCANIGNCKCFIYTSSSIIKLSYDSGPNVYSEKVRIKDYKEKHKNEESNNINFKKLFSSYRWFLENYKFKEMKKIYEVEQTKKHNLLNEFKSLKISRCIGNFGAHLECGLSQEPDILECNLKTNHAKFCIIGTEGLWKYITEEEAGRIVRKYFFTSQTFAACRALEEVAREKWKRLSRKVDDITVIVIFFDNKDTSDAQYL